MSLTVLGVFPLFLNVHDANIALVVDGKPVYAYEEEKLSRTKYDGRVPLQGVWAALNKAFLTPKDIDIIVFPGLKEAHSIFINQFMWRTLLREAQTAEKNFKIEYISHHAAHVATAVHCSPFQETLYLSLDNGGDDGYGTGGYFDGQNFQQIFQITKPHICTLYSYLTYIADFARFEEGKAMGLASYGKLNKPLYEYLKKVMPFANDGYNVIFDRQQHFSHFTTLKPKKFSADTFRLEKINKDTCECLTFPELNYIAKEDVCFTMQKFAEDITIEIVKKLYSVKKCTNICLTGGLFANIKINSIVEKLPFIKNVYIPPNPGDGGLALGGALQKSFEVLGKLNVKTPITPYLGPKFSRHQIEAEIKNFNLKYSRIKNTEKRIAQLLTQGKIIGWFQGAGEWGPRALGNRSVLADPLNPKSKSRLNQLLKKRDWFMPFAPSVLAEKAHEVFEGITTCEYMNKAYSISKKYQGKLGDAVHVDGSSRPQTVSEINNPRYYKIIKEYYQLTGIPVVLNTSFNRHGLPTIGTPRQALEHLVWGSIDLLFVEDFLIERDFIRSPESTNLQTEENELQQLHLKILNCIFDDALEIETKIRLITEKFPTIPYNLLKQVIKDSSLTNQEKLLRLKKLIIY